MPHFFINSECISGNSAEEKCTALFLCCLHMGYGSFNLSAPQIINDIFLADSRSVYMEQGVS